MQSATTAVRKAVVGLMCRLMKAGCMQPASASLRTSSSSSEAQSRCLRSKVQVGSVAAWQSLQTSTYAATGAWLVVMDRSPIGYG